MSESAGRFCLLTGAGPAAIAVIQIKAVDVAARVAALCRLPVERLPGVGRMRIAALYPGEDDPIDEVLVSTHAADEIRLHLHGSPWIVRRLSAELAGGGLTQVEEMIEQGGSRLERAAWRLVPEMSTLAGVRWLAGQPERVRAALTAGEDESPERLRRRVRGLLVGAGVRRWFAEPVRIAVVGPPNAGKSTLINALTRRQACLVSDRPGTTRDWNEVHAELAGFPVTWLDTAGLRETEDPLEAAGMAHTRAQVAAADGVVLVLEGGGEIPWGAWQRVLGQRPLAVVLNKSDVAGFGGLFGVPRGWRGRLVSLCARSESGLGALVAMLPGNMGRNCTQLSSASCFTAALRSDLESLCGGLDAEIRGRLACVGAGWAV